MLHWLAGQRPIDRGRFDEHSRLHDLMEPDNDNHFEPPETPAPLFAVRAFKQAIFGTPAPAASPKTRRNSSHDRDASRALSKPTRPLMMRPKSANDANAGVRIDEMPPSPTKGILLTPGTIGERRKTVTFGDFVPDKSRAGEFELDVNNDGSLKRVQPDQSRPIRSSETDRKNRRQSASTSSPIDNESAKPCENCYKHNLQAGDFTDEEPDCPVGRYWKREYDIYRDNTSRELRKLITKQQAAKSYAREKDEQCAALTDDLADERRKVERLESKNKELEAMLDGLRQQLALTKTNTAVREIRSATIDSPAMSPTAPEVKSIRGQQLTNVTSSTTAPSLPRRERSNILNDTVLSTSPTDIPDKTASTPAYQSRRRPQRHDSFEPGSSFLASELKQESTYLADLPKTIPTPTANNDQLPAQQQQLEAKSIVSKDGEVIPAERVAAARARLAARRQLRTAS